MPKPTDEGDVDETPKNHSMPYDGRDDNKPEQEDEEKGLDEAAEKAVADQHGVRSKDSPQYDELVNDAKDQIKSAVDENKDM